MILENDKVIEFFNKKDKQEQRTIYAKLRLYVAKSLGKSESDYQKELKDSIDTINWTIYNIKPSGEPVKMLMMVYFDAKYCKWTECNGNESQKNKSIEDFRLYLGLTPFYDIH